jgi:V/A-type H+-transporting ATPase subunit F
MSSVAVLGERDAVLGFKASGAAVYPADNLQEAKEQLDRLLKLDYAILLITEDLAESLKAELVPLYDLPKPVITILPAAGKEKSIGMERLIKQVERAIGANILFKGEE